MSRKTSNSIIDSFFIISESIKELSISDDEYVDIMKSQKYLHIFDSVKDFRQNGKIEYSLGDILMLAFIVIMKKGRGAFYYISDYIRINIDTFTEMGLIKDGKVPSHDTFRYIFTYLDGDSLQEETVGAFYNFLRDLEKEIPAKRRVRHIGVDGKEVTSSGRSKHCNSPSRNASMLNIYDSGLCTCIVSKAIDEKTNEIPVSQELLLKMNLNKVIVTADALHCQKDTVRIISRKKGYYLLVVKDNQETLANEMKDRFEKYKDRVEVIKRGERTLEIYNLPKNYARDGWTGMKVFVRMTSKRKGREECVRYFISNSVDRELICEAIESRWEIENGFHKEKDDKLDEDSLRSRDKNTLQNLVIMNNFIMQLIHIYSMIFGLSTRHATMRFSEQPIKCLCEILAFKSSEEIINQLKQLLKKR